MSSLGRESQESNRMLNMTRLTDQGNDARSGAAVLAYLKATEYYIGQDGQLKSCSQWIGHGAAILGLNGEVDISMMEKLAFGVGPNGEPLRQNAGNSQRVGWDFTFSSVKSFSIAYAVANAEDKEQLLDAHHNAVNRAFTYLETLGQVRTGKEGLGEKQDIRGLVISRHTHFGSRDLDPQVHSHGLCYNVAQGEDGKWRALDTEKMARNVRAAGALYRAEHAWELRKLGFGIVKDRRYDADGRETGEIFFNIAGVSDELMETFSKRREAIVAYQAEHGGSYQQACLATRKNKDEPTYAELVSVWGETLDQMRVDHPSLVFKDVESLKGLPCEFDTFDDARILEDLHATEAKFTHAQVVERIAMENVGQMSVDQILVEADAFLERNHIVRLERGAKSRLSADEPEFAAQWMVEMEHEIGIRGRKRLDDQSVKLNPDVVEASILQVQNDEGIQFTSEQADVIRHATVETGGTTIITGRAGTGKTMSAKGIVHAFRAEGRNLIGVSTGWDAAKKLEAESHIVSHSSEKLLTDLDNGKLILTAKDVVIFDEAGMAGTQVIHRIQTYTDVAGAKLILQGDAQQLQPVSAGNPFALLTKEIGEKSLTEIRRQQHAEDRDTANMLYGAAGFSLGAQVMDRLVDRGQVFGFETRKHAIDQVADDWMQSKMADREKLVIGGTRAEVSLLNEAIRKRRQETGVVGQDQAQFDAKAGGNWLKLKLGNGDRVRFSAKDTNLGVFNGTSGVVKDLKQGRDKGSYVVTVRTESDVKGMDGRTVVFDTADFFSLSHDYAMTVHKSQGQGRHEVYHLASPSMTDKHLQLVAFTRTKKTYAMYGSEDDLGEMRKRAGQERLKVNAIEQLPKNPTPQIAEIGKKLGEAIKTEQLRKKGKGISLSKK